MKKIIIFLRKYGVFRMKYKMAGLLHPERCDTVKGIYVGSTNTEARAFVDCLRSLDFSAARNQELERKLKQDVEKIILAVIVGWTINRYVLDEARRYYHDFSKRAAKET